MKLNYGCDIHDIYTYYSVDTSKIPADTKKKLEDVGYDVGGNFVYISREDIDQYDVPYMAVDIDDYYEDKEKMESVFDSILKKAPYYLVVANACRWNGSSGYLLETRREWCFSRSYDATISPLECSQGKKNLLCRESSHDVPMGSDTHIVALTSEEYTKARRWLNAEEYPKVRKLAGM